MNKDGLSYPVICSLMLRDKFWFPATQARSIAEGMATLAEDLATIKFEEPPFETVVKAMADALAGDGKWAVNEFCLSSFSDHRFNELLFQAVI